MNYKITSFDPKVGSISVSFEDGEFCTVLVPVEDNKYIVGAALDAFIESCVSKDAVQRNAQIVFVTNASDIEALVDTPVLNLNTMTLDMAKTNAKALINASAYRAMTIDSTPNMDRVYDIKYGEAKMYLADPVSYNPILLRNESSTTGMELNKLCQTVIIKHEAVEVLMERIEPLRIAGRMRIDSCNTTQTVQDTLNAVLATIK